MNILLKRSFFVILITGLICVPEIGWHVLWGFQSNAYQSAFQAREEDPLQIVEAGLSEQKKLPASFIHLEKGEYQKALEALTPEVEGEFPWLRGYLEGTADVSESLVHVSSEHFDVYVPPDQTFLADYAVPSLEKTADRMEELWGYRPENKIRVEIYPTKETFSVASTLSLEILKNSGAIGICKFHRLMIMSPQSLPLGYRWLDALAHEYNHLIINELSESRAELWLHEGTARYFDTAYRSDPPDFLSPHQKTKLLEALEENKLISFKRMSPSLVYLDGQEEVNLAFAEVSHAISKVIDYYGSKKFVTFLKMLRKKSFPHSFKAVFKMTPDEFEERWRGWLKDEEWEKTNGTMSDDVVFGELNEDDVIGATAQAKVRLGDKMRMRGHVEAALIEYEKALAEEPDNAIILLKAARSHLEMKQIEEAIEKLYLAIEKNPNYGTPYVELARWVGPEERLPLVETANAINPFDPRIHALWADALKRLGKDEAAKREEAITNQLISQMRSR